MTFDAPRLAVPDRALSSARMKVGRAAWAARYYRTFSREAVLAIAEAMAKAGYDKAGEFADLAVSETGYGVVEHKTLKNQLCTHELLDHYRDLDLVTPRLDAERKIVELPKPAGVVFALAPATNPVATVYYKAMLAVLSRNAIVISPHPAAKRVSARAAQHLAEAAEAAGAPAGLIQCVEEPSIPLVQDIMSSDRINVIIATGGTAMVRAAYSSGNPALGVGPGNAVAYVDPSAKADAAAKCLVDSKSFDNSILCTNESVVLTLDSNRANMERALRSAGAHVCNEADTDRLRDYLFADDSFNLDALGKSAQWIAERAGPGDVVITGDIPLAAKCIEAGAQVLKPNGEALTATNIGPVLATRDLMADLRSADPFRQGGGRGFTKADRSRFLDALERALRRAAPK